MKILLFFLCLISLHSFGQSVLIKPNGGNGILSKNTSLCLTCAIPGNYVPLSGGGTKFMWLPELSAFRAGTVEDNTNYWDTGLVGNWSFASAYNTVARGSFSTAFGLRSKAMGTLSTAFGWSVEANDYATFACGSYNVIATGSRDIFYPTEQIFVIGNGTSENNRNNAVTVLKNGNVGINALNPVSKLDIVGSNTGWRSHFCYDGDGTEDTYIRGGKAASKVIINDIDGLGGVGIGTVPTLNSDEKVDIKGRLRIRQAASTSGVWMNNSTNSLNINDGAFYGMLNDTQTGIFIGGTWKFWVNNTGNGYLNGNLIQTSDKRLKKDFYLLTNSLSSIYKLNGYHFKWIEEARSKDLQTGLIAQEVQKIFPELVQTDEKGFLSVNYIGLVPHLIEAVKELRDENNALKNNNQTLASRLDKIEAMLTTIQPNTENSNSKK